MLLDGFQENSFTHWSGRISSVIYFSKTNLLPAYMRAEQNPFLAKPTPWPRIRIFLEKSKDWIDGIVLAGGEPTLSKDIIILCQKIKQAGFPIKLCTNGTNPDVVSELIRRNLIDEVLIDVYAPLDFPNYSKITALRDKQKFLSIRRTVSNVLTSEFPHEIRTIVAHGFHTPQLIKELTGHIRIAKRYVLQNAPEEYALTTRELNTLGFAAKEIIRNTEIRKTTS